MKDIWIEVFRSGLQTDSSGRQRHWTESDLEKIVHAYNNQPDHSRHEAPVVIGHPVTDSPAYGWVAELKKEGRTMFAKLTRLSPKFVEWVKQGLYRKRSIALYENLMLKHVGFLGGIPPAVKGLADPAFSAKTDETGVSNWVVDFGSRGSSKLFKNNRSGISSGKKNGYSSRKNFQYSNSLINNYLETRMIDEQQLNLIFAGLVSWLSETFNEEVANQASAYIEEAMSKYQMPAASVSNPDAEGVETPLSQPPATAIEASETGMVTELRNRISRLEWENRLKDVNTYADSLIGNGTIVPAQRQLVVSALELGQRSGVSSFVENGIRRRDKGEDLIKRLIESFPAQVEFGEKATKSFVGDQRSVIYGFENVNTDSEAMGLHVKVVNFQEESRRQGKIISYKEALSIVRKGVN